MAEESQLNGINVFRSWAQYEGNLDKIKKDEISLIIEDPNEYVKRSEFESLKKQVEELRKALGVRND